MGKWYEQIDARIRDLIFQLRNNGINTTCSNGEKGYIEAEWHDDSNPTVAYQTCKDAGFKLIRLECIWTTFPMLQKYMKIRLYDRIFGNVPDTYIPKQYVDIITPPKKERRTRLSTNKEDLVSLESKCLRHVEVIIAGLEDDFPESTFISQFDRRIVDEEISEKNDKTKEAIYILNYDPKRSQEFEKITVSFTDINFYKLSIEETEKRRELFQKLGLLAF